MTDNTFMEWTSVKDSNPNFYGKYLVVCKGIDIPQIRLYEGGLGFYSRGYTLDGTS